MTAPETPSPDRGRTIGIPSAAVAVAAAGVALFFTWRRLFVGMDLQDESYYVLVPWRWALGRPALRGRAEPAAAPGAPDVSLRQGVRGAARLRRDGADAVHAPPLSAADGRRRGGRLPAAAAARCSWPLALLASGVVVTYIYWATPQLSYNTMALAFLTAGRRPGAWVVVAGGGAGWRCWPPASAWGSPCVAYPTLLFVVPFWAVLFAFAYRAPGDGHDRRGRRSRIRRIPQGPPTGPAAWRALSAWDLGGVARARPGRAAAAELRAAQSGAGAGASMQAAPR